MCLGPLGGDVVAELPFTLMHPKPEDSNHTTFNNSLRNHLNSLSPTNNNNSTNNGIIENGNNTKLNSKSLSNNNSNDTLEQNLIQLDT